MGTLNLPPDLQLLREGMGRSLRIYQENHDRKRIPILAETYDRRRVEYMRGYLDWVGGDPIEKIKMGQLCKDIEQYWGWGEGGEAETKG